MKRRERACERVGVLDGDIGHEEGCEMAFRYVSGSRRQCSSWGVKVLKSTRGLVKRVQQLHFEIRVRDGGIK